MKIRNQLVASRRKTWAGKNACTSITVHETANRSRGANAAAHANLQSKGNVRQASWHIQVDDREAVRSFPDDVRTWHAGWDARDSLSLEICVNADGDLDKAYANAAAVVKAWRALHKVPASRVVQHNTWTGKNCPTILRSRGDWAAFVRATEPGAVDKGKSVVGRVVNVVKPKPKTVAGNWLRRGSTGARVKNLQRGLNRVFPAYSKLAVDGSFGPATERVVKEFQRRTGLVQDGSVGPATTAMLARHGIKF